MCVCVLEISWAETAVCNVVRVCGKNTDKIGVISDCKNGNCKLDLNETDYGEL